MSTGTENRLVNTRGWGEGSRERLLNGHEDSWGGKDILEPDGQLHNTVSILNVTELYTTRWSKMENFI